LSVVVAVFLIELDWNEACDHDADGKARPGIAESRGSTTGFENKKSRYMEAYIWV